MLLPSAVSVFVCYLHGFLEDDGVEEPGEGQAYCHVEEVGADGGGDCHVALGVAIVELHDWFKS